MSFLLAALKVTDLASQQCSFQFRAEYDNLENAYSSPPQPTVQASITNNRLLRRGSRRSGGWRPRDARNHRKGGGGSQLRGKIDQQVRINAHIVDEARRICQRLHAMGWESALSLQTHSSESNPTGKLIKIKLTAFLLSKINRCGTSKTAFR